MKYFCYTAGLFVLAFADTPPTAADINFTINEDTTKAFTVNDFAYADAEDDPLSHIVITTLSTQGTLSLEGTDVSAAQQITASRISELLFTPVPNGNGTPYATFGFQVSDGTATSAEYTATINVTPMDEAWLSHPGFHTDADDDGLPDEWEMLMHGDLETIDSTTDFDNDGYSDLTEFTLFLDNYDPHTAIAARNEACYRIPPMIEVLTMPETMLASQTYTIAWKTLGYDAGYTTLIDLFDCTGMAAEACGASFSQNFYYKQLFTPVSVEDADWSYNGEKAQYFTFSHDITLPSTRADGSAWAAGGTDIVVRFYQKNAIDTEAGKQSISLLIPGNVTANYYDATGRRILKRVCPGSGCE